MARTEVAVYELAHYWYHRAAHKVNWLWRAAHQMHHSAESVEAIGASYLHPVDTVMFTTWAVLAVFRVPCFRSLAVSVHPPRSPSPPPQ